MTSPAMTTKDKIPGGAHAPSGSPPKGGTDLRGLRRDLARVRQERERNGADPHQPQTDPQVLREDRRSRRDAEPDRGSEGVLRPVPADPRTFERPDRRRLAGRFQIGVPDLGLLRELDAGIRALRIRGAEI